MRILVGFIDSPEGRAALEAAIAEARLRDGELIVVHSMRGGERDEAEQAAVYRDRLSDVTDRLKAEGVTHQIRELVRGKPAGEDLVAFASENDVDLIVIGLRRRSPVGKLVLGSNAQDVLLTAHCPVLAVKAATTEE